MLIDVMPKTEKQAIVCYESFDFDDILHYAWRYGDQILMVELLTANHPKTFVKAFPSVQDYLRCINPENNLGAEFMDQIKEVLVNNVSEELWDELELRWIADWKDQDDE